MELLSLLIRAKFCLPHFSASYSPSLVSFECMLTLCVRYLGRRLHSHNWRQHKCHSARISMRSFVGNVWLVYTSLRSNVLTIKTNKLIVVLAISDLNCNIGYIQVLDDRPYNDCRFSSLQSGLFDVFDLYNHFTQRECFWIMLYQKYDLEANIVLITVLGLDRLLALSFPLQ